MRRARTSLLGAALCLATAAVLGCAAAGAPDVLDPPLGSPTPAPSAEGSRPAVLDTVDGVALSARHFPAEPGRLVVLMHQYTLDQSSWYDAARRLQAQGVAALTFDFRGFGGSSGKRDTLTLGTDVRAALEFARANGYTNVLLVGASMGGTAAIYAAGTPPRDEAARAVDGVVTISAPELFGDLDATTAAGALRVPLFLVAAKLDASAYESFKELGEAAAVPTSRRVLAEGDAHGTDLLGSDASAAIWLGLERFIDELWPSARQTDGLS